MAAEDLDEHEPSLEQPSAALGLVVGSHPQTRAQIMAKFWVYVGERQLTDHVNADAALSSVFGGRTRVAPDEVSALIHDHLSPTPPSGSHQHRVLVPSPALAKIVGPDARDRSSITSDLFAYVEHNELWDKRGVLADTLLLPFFGGKAVVSRVEFSRRIDKHLSLPPVLEVLKAPTPALNEAWAEERRGLERRLRAEMEAKIQEQLARFDRAKRTAAGPLTESHEPPAWAAAIADERTREVFVHLWIHRVISENELVQFLGSPRAFRRFAAEFEQHLAVVPFRVRIEAAPDGKRYVKEEEK